MRLRRPLALLAALACLAMALPPAPAAHGDAVVYRAVLFGHQKCTVVAEGVPIAGTGTWRFVLQRLEFCSARAHACVLPGSVEDGFGPAPCGDLHFGSTFAVTGTGHHHDPAPTLEEHDIVLTHCLGPCWPGDTAPGTVTVASA